jgi:hypothetical protein
LLVDCAQLKAAMLSETQDKMPEYRLRLFIFSPCLPRLPGGIPFGEYTHPPSEKARNPLLTT